MCVCVCVNMQECMQSFIVFIAVVSLQISEKIVTEIIKEEVGSEEGEITSVLTCDQTVS